MRARAYHRPLYLVLAVDSALGAAVMAVLRWSSPGRELYGAVAGLGWAGAAAAWAGIVLTVATAVRVPSSFWRGWWRERRWGFSTQPLPGWLADVARAFAISLAAVAGAWTGAVALARALPGTWALPAGGSAAAAVLLLSFVAPVLLEPLFNRFAPLGDEVLAGELRELAERAGVPVREVLVADASRRTTKVNAYVSGLGRTRRVVLFDTLLASSEPREVRLIVAHELGHRRERHVAAFTLLAMAGAVAVVAVLWAVLGTRVGSPSELPVALLLVLGLEWLGLAPGAALSRRFERTADRWSLELTRDVEAFERAHRALALRNLADLEPPRLAYLLLFSHPTPPDRLAAGRAWVAAHPAAT